MHEYSLALCTVMLLDFTVPAEQPPEDPALLQKLVHELVGKALQGLAENSRIAVETERAAAVYFLGDPEAALHSALVLRDLVSQRYAGLMTVRIGLNMGPVRIMTDLNDRAHITGLGVQAAARLKKLAGPNEVLASHTYHQLISRLNPDTLDLFQYHGPSEKRPLEMYSVISAAPEGQHEALSSFVLTHPTPLFQGTSMDPEAVHDIESELAGYIGPLARVLVRKAEHRVADAQGLRELLACAILNPHTREFFLVGKLGQTAPLPAHDDNTLPLGTRGLPAACAGPNADSTRQVDIAPAELAIIEHTLNRFIGPMAQPLMRREIDYCLQFADFVKALSGAIGHPEQRRIFLQALQRALPDRRV